MTDITDFVLTTLIKPNASTIADIVINNEVACIVYEPRNIIYGIAWTCGWDGINNVFQMHDRQKIAAELNKTHPESGSWILRNDHGKIIILIKSGILLINHSTNYGYWLEEDQIAIDGMSN